MRRLIALGIIASVATVQTAVMSLAQGASWPTTDWVTLCSVEPNVICDLTDPGVAASGVQLEEASRFLEALGFRPPDVIHSVPGDETSPLVSYVQEDLISDERHVHGYYSSARRSIYLDYGSFFAMGTETSEGMDAPTHELFHAIQASYDALDIFFTERSRGIWVLEGMAEAVDQAYGGLRHEGSSRGRPMLNYPLHDLRRRDGNEDLTNPYLSYPFWLHFAETYGGQLPGGIGIYHDFYLAAQEQDADGHSIEIVDGALRDIVAGGLYTVYPRFIADYGADESHYNDLGDQALLTVTPDYQIDDIIIEGSVEPVAAAPERLTIANGWAPHDDSEAEVQIRLVGPRSRDLHLVVDNRAYNTPEAGADGIRNLFIDTLEPAESDLLPHFSLNRYFIKVVNAAQRTQDVREPRDYRIEVSLFREFVDVQGRLWDDGPGPEDIDSPIPMDMEPTGVYVFPHASDEHTAAGFSDPCLLRLFLRDEDTGDRIAISLDNDGKFEPGEYAVASLDRFGGELMVNHPGQAVSGFRLGRDNVATAGREYEYYGVGGVLEIRKITPRWIVGSVRIAGNRQRDGEWTDVGWVDYPGDLANLEITVDFSLRHERPADADQYLDVKECLNYEEPVPIPIPIPTPVPTPTPTPEEQLTEREAPEASSVPQDETVPEEETASSPPESRTANSSDPDMRAEELRTGDPRFSLLLTGAQEAEIAIFGPTLGFTGQCGLKSPFFLTVFRGLPETESYLNMALSAATPVMTDGPMPIPDIRIRHADASLLTGSADLVIESAEPRLAGRATGVLRDATGAESALEASFDLPLRCGP